VHAGGRIVCLFEFEEGQKRGPDIGPPFVELLASGLLCPGLLVFFRLGNGFVGFYLDVRLGERGLQVMDSLAQRFW
jgi:hypothetical protein